jgi:putative inorganic carbon (HCO3(-)) transporter
MIPRPRGVPPLLVPLALYLCGALIAAALSYAPGLTVSWLLALSLNIGLIVGITFAARSERALRWVASGAVTCATVIALAIIFQYRHLGWLDEFDPATQAGRLLSSGLPPLIDLGLTANAAATLFEGPLLLAIGLSVDQRGWRRRLWGGCALVLALGTFLTDSRGTWIALLVVAAIGVLAVVRRRGRLPGRGVVWGAGAGALALGLLVIALTALRPDIASSVLSRAIDRGQLYRNSLYLALEFPYTGVGGGSVFALAYSRLELLIQVPFLTYPHNLLLSVWLWHGLIGLAGFCALILVTWRLVWRALPTIGPIGLGAALGALVNLLHGVTDAPQYDKALAMISASLVFAVMVAAARLANPAPLKWVRLGRRGWGAFAAAGVAALLLFGPGLLARGFANIAWIKYGHVALVDGLTPAEREAGLAAARAWADRGLRVSAGTPGALKARGLVDLATGQYGDAIAALERAAVALPEDQSTIKALGLASIWYGYTAEGAQLLSTLDRAEEAYGELSTWENYWHEQGREDLAARAREAQQAFGRQVLAHGSR